MSGCFVKGSESSMMSEPRDVQPKKRLTGERSNDRGERRRRPENVQRRSGVHDSSRSCKRERAWTRTMLRCVCFVKAQ